MRQRVFEERNEARWTAFTASIEALDALGRRRPVGTARTDFDAFPDHYREICRDLAVATERRYSVQLLDRLNAMAIEGHRILYTRETNLLLRLARFVAGEFPRAVRRDWVFVAFATALFVLPTFVVAGLIAMHPELVYSVLDGAQVQDFEAMYDPGAKTLGENRDAETDFAMFGFYVWNNISVAFRAYASGILFGIGSAFALASNGLLLGAVGAHLTTIGFAETFFSFVIGHGSFELTAIVLSGAAGLRLGWSLIAPGAETRRVALRRAAIETVPIVYGIVGMLLFAAVLEAFWSSKGSILPEIKFSVGAVLWAVVLAYLGWAGRRTDSTGALRGGE